MASDFDVVVVGGGAMGSAAAWQISKHSSNRCVVLEAQEFGHKRGSSHGESRIYRQTDVNGHLADMAVRALPTWRELETDSAETLLTVTGSIDLGPTTSAQVRSIIDNARDLDGAQVVRGAEIAAALPAMRLPVPSDAVAVVQRDGGIINADKTITTLRREAIRHGARFESNCRVAGLKRPQSSGGRYVVSTSTGKEFTAQKLVLCPGAWTSEVLALLGFPLHTEIWQMQYGFWDVDQDSLGLHKGRVWRSFYDRLYGFPVHENPGQVKAARHLVTEASTFTSPSQVPYTENIPVLKDTDREVKRLLRGLDKFAPGPPCLYTVAADGKFVLGKVRGTSGSVVVAGAFAGSGFKHVPFVGKLLKDLVCTGHTDFDISPFDPSRPTLATPAAHAKL